MTATKRAGKRSAKHESYRHVQSKRTKIPTESDDRYMDDEDRKPVMFSPEARSEESSPRLSWRRNTGKDDVARAAHKLYVQEKVDPSWFVNHLIDKTDSGQTHLFAFNGFPKDTKYDWYKHKGNWSNRLIHGDASGVMASLLNWEGLKGEVQMIYFDPPYGIKFDSMFQVSTKNRDGGAPNDSKSRKAFRDTYTDGIHSYLNWIYRVAKYAWNMLKDSGSFFLQISSEHLHRVAIILDEVFGAENRKATIPFATTSSSSSNTLPDVTTWLLWYAKDKDQTKYHQLYEPLESAKEKLEHMSSYAMVEESDGTIRSLTPDEKVNPDSIPDDARLFRRMRLTSQQESKTGRSGPFVWDGVRYDCPKNEHWRVSHDGLKKLGEMNRLVATEGGRLSWKRYADEVPGRKLNNLWCKQMAPTDMHFIVETSPSVIERCMLMTTDPGDLVLDPTCGSGVTAAVAESWGRRWITIEVNPIQVALCRQRIITLINDWYLTKDSTEGSREEARLAGLDTPAGSDAPGRQYDPGSGFVYKRIPSTSAGVLAYGKDPNPTLLVNHPIKKRGMKRISSPFTVESISPHKYVSVEEYGGGRNETADTVLDGLSVAGIIIQGTGERWHIDDASVWENGVTLTHRARIRETGETVAMVLLPDDQTCGMNLVNKAAEEATNYPGIKRMLVLAFEFEAAAYGQDIERRGRLEIHKVGINGDLVLGDLKHGANDSSFTMIGEPHIDVLQHGKQWVVRVNGYDTFNIRTNKLDDRGADMVYCWMLDTNYDSQSFFARRIHLPGQQNDGYVKKLKVKLAKSVNPEHWEKMLSLESTPFDTPENGRIAVRIVTADGNVMTTVHEISPGN